MANLPVLWKGPIEDDREDFQEVEVDKMNLGWKFGGKNSGCWKYKLKFIRSS